MGMMGGVALALALVAPLYVGLPSHHVSDWMYMTAGGGQAGVILAGLVLLGTGFLAAALAPTDAIRAGTAASLVAAFLGATWMLSPGFVVEALGELLDMDSRAGEPTQMVASALERVLWYPATASLGLLVAGPGLGALGGITFDLWYAEPSRPLRVIRPSPVPFVGMFATTLWGVALAYLWTGAIDQLETLDGTIGAIKQSAAPAILGLWNTFFLCWALRDAVLWLRGGVRLRGVVWALGAVAFGLLTLTPLAYSPTVAASPVVLALVAASLVAAIGTLVGAGRGNIALDTARRTISDLLVEAMLIGGLTVGIGLLTVGPLVLANHLILEPALQLLAGQDTDEVQSVSVVRLLFTYHWMSVIPMAGLAAGWSVIRLPTAWMHRALQD